MDTNTFTTLISSVGFPIVACLGLAYFIYKSYNSLSAANKEREQALYECLAKAQVTIEQAIENNAKLNSLLDRYIKDTTDLKNDVEIIKDTIQKLPKRKGDVSEDE